MEQLPPTKIVRVKSSKTGSWWTDGLLPTSGSGLLSSPPEQIDSHYFRFKLLQSIKRSNTIEAVFSNSEDLYYTSMNQEKKDNFKSINQILWTLEINLFWSAIIRINLLFYSNKLSVYHGTFDKWFRTQKRKYIFFSEKIFRIVTALKSNPMP